MDFYDEFPNIGITGEIKLKLRNELEFFFKKQDMRIYMPHPGWIVPRSVYDAEILAYSRFKTIKDYMTSPIISLLERGKGTAIYTSYHNETGSCELQRYISYRLAYDNLLDSLLKKISFWEQEINSSIIDSIREWEHCRAYKLKLAQGKNTIYFITDKATFQLDVFDKDYKLIVSKDSRETEFFIDIHSNFDQYLIIKIYIVLYQYKTS